MTIRVGYVHSEALVQACDELPANKGRAGLVHSLVEASGFLDALLPIVPDIVDEEHLVRFHDTELVDALLTSNHNHLSDEDLEEIGLVDDCCIFESMGDYVRLVAGGSIAAAHALIENNVDIAVHLNGGRHHAKRYRADGFCYVNDIVLATLELLDYFDRVLYIDLDVHHGDGVEQAFAYSSRVMTCSFHHYRPGFFPGTGNMENSPNRQCFVNFPLLEGLDDDGFIDLFKQSFPRIINSFQPSVIILQCGADGLFEDPNKVWNLTEKSFKFATTMVRDLNRPLLILGGGGYNHTATAKCWVHVLATLLNRTLHEDVPEHDRFVEYGPDFMMYCEKGNMTNLNTHDYVHSVMEYVERNLLQLNIEQ